MLRINLPPIEFSKCLVVDIECYPKLLKRFQEGKVGTTPIKTEVERLCSIKTKIISKSDFDKYITKNTDHSACSKDPVIPKVASTDQQSSDLSPEDLDGQEDAETDPPMI